MLYKNLHIILMLISFIIPAWTIISAYNKRVNEIKELREDVEWLKQKDEDAGSSAEEKTIQF